MALAQTVLEKFHPKPSQAYAAFLKFFLRDNFRSEVGSDVVSSAYAKLVGVDVDAKFGDST